jgi:pyridoxamine 5'-phosphate oxidase
LDLLDEAIERFNQRYEQIKASGINEPTAMVVATVDSRGRPAARALLLKKVDRRGFVFFTNTMSRKGGHLAENPYAALCFLWQPLMQQVQVEGRVEPVSSEEADGYWQTRPRASQLGAWASKQSQLLPDRNILLERVKEYEIKFQEQDVPRPENWSGYRVVPEMIEFWHAHPDRLNERLRYRLVDSEWCKENLYP